MRVRNRCESSSSLTTSALLMLGLAAGAATIASRPLAASPVAAVTRQTGGGWTPLGLYGGNVQALAIDPTNPNVVYAATDSGGGVFKSTDGAATWTGLYAELPRFEALALAIDPRHPFTIYVSLAGGAGVYKSRDGGVTWNATGSGLRSVAATLAIDPIHARTLYAGSAAGVDKSVDGGGTWTPAGQGLPADRGAVVALAIDPGSTQTVYAVLQGSISGRDGAVFKTTDGGVSWSEAGAVASPITAVALAVDPSAPRTVYLAVTTGIYKSMDGAASWTRSDTGSALGSDAVVSLAIDPGAPRTLYAGSVAGRVIKSADGGASWTLAVRDPAQWVRVLAVDPAGSGVVYAGTLGTAALGGVYRSGDRGTSWARRVQGLTAAALAALAVSPQTASTLYATTGNELFATHDGGVTWNPRAVPPAGLEPDSFVLQMAVDPLAASTLYVASEAFTFGGHPHFGLFRSGDGGASWTQLVAPQAGWVAIDPLDDRILYVGPFVARSADGGGTWMPLSGNGLPPAVKQLVIDPTAPANVYALQYGSPNLWKSTDRGLTWRLTGTTLINLDALRVDPNASATLYAAAGGYVEKSADGGVTWQVVYSPADPARHGASAIAVAPMAPSTLYAVVGGGVVGSADGGATWGGVATGALGGPVASLEIDPQDPRRLIANVSGAGPESMTVAAAPGPCLAGLAALCLNDRRFRVTATWQTGQGSGDAQALGLTSDTGALWFFDAANLEVMVKVVNGCALNGHYWVFAGGLTDVGVTLNVIDTLTGDFKTYPKSPGVPFAPLEDTGAFGSCP
jgi:photosystem II stability/assembly factor-like uncharacterized protein